MKLWSGPVAVALAGSALASAQSVEQDVHPDVPTSSQQFTKSGDRVESFLARRGFDDALLGPSLGSASSEDLPRRRQAIIAATPIAGVALGTSERYDVILQPGHYGRRSGVTGTGGRLVSEQQLTAFVTAGVADRLRRFGKKVLVVGADDFRRDDPVTPGYEGLSAKVFISFHADGSVKPCSTGPSLAYAQDSSTYAMHAIGWGLGRALGYDYADFRRDGFTTDAKNYYMFKRVRASELAGLLELGELTCPKSEEVLVRNASAVAANVAHALNFVLDTPYSPPS